MNVFSAGDGNSLLNYTVKKKARNKPKMYQEIPACSIAAFTAIADSAYREEKIGNIPEAIRRFKDLHNISLLSWTKPMYLSPEQRYEIRMTMKIIRMELKRLREKMTVDHS